MNEIEALIQNEIKNVKEIMQNNPSKKVCVWWRGRLSGIASCSIGSTKEKYIVQLKKAVQNLCKIEDKVN